MIADPLRPCPSSSEHDGRYRCTDDCPLCLGKGIVRVAPGGQLGPVVSGTLADVIDWLRERVPLPGESTSSAPSCYRCENGEHDACGGPESGCGCAAEGHGFAWY
jgi:hypothetical protein